MKRPIWRSAGFTAVSGILGLSILAGCGTQPSGTRATDETARYLQNARGRYAIPGTRGDPWGPYIREASRRFDVPERWIRALMRQESGGNLFRGGHLITSSAGAMGLMQIMPGTYQELRDRHNLGPDPFDPHDNIMAGVAYMREMYDIYGAPGFLAAYNAGPNRLDDYLANQRGLPAETRQYVASIGPVLRTASPRVRSPAEQYAINQIPIHISPGPRFGYGNVQAPIMSLASAAPVYPSTPMRPTEVAFTTRLPIQQSSVLAWSEPPRRSAHHAPVGHWRVTARSSSRIAVANATKPSVRRHGAGLHLVSSALAAEVSPAQHHRKARLVRVSYVKYAATRASSSKASRWTRVAARQVHTAATCHHTEHGKLLCGPARVAKRR
jgi:hypothetical protein